LLFDRFLFLSSGTKITYLEIIDYRKMSAIDSHSRSNLGGFPNPIVCIDCPGKLGCFDPRLIWCALRTMREFAA
jgi:hypothetical protein